MAVKDCIKLLRKAGHKVTLSDRRALDKYIKTGMTDKQAVQTILIDATLDLIDITEVVQREGGQVRGPMGRIAEIRNIRTERLRKLMNVDRANIVEKQDKLRDEYVDMQQDAEIFDELLSKALGYNIRFEDMTESEAKFHFGQLMMRATVTELGPERPGQRPDRIWPEDRFRVAMERETLSVFGRTPDEIYNSRGELEQRLAQNRYEHQMLEIEKAEVQREIDQIVGVDTTLFQGPDDTDLSRLSEGETDQLFKDSDIVDEELEAVGAKADVNKARMAELLGAQLYGDMSKIQAVAIKETFQNAFDAVRSAVRQGQIEDGEIYIEISADGRTMTIRDNGTGMDAEKINDAFLSLAGTGKEEGENSGGFGVAKGLFLAGAKSLKLTTVKDGIKTTLETTGVDFMQSLRDPNHSLDQRYPVDKALRRSRTNEANGTEITIVIPDKYFDFKSQTEKDVRPFQGFDIGDVANGQILHPKITVKNKILNSSWDPEGVKDRNSGANFNWNNYTKIATVQFEWGDADIIVEKEPRDEFYGDNTWIAINGLNQLKVDVSENPWDPGASHIQRQIYFDLHPRKKDGTPIKAGEPGYPIALNRQELMPHAKEDLFQIKSYLSVLLWRDKAAESAKGYGTLKTIDLNGNVIDELDLTPPPPRQQEGLKGKLQTGDSLKVEGGELVVDGVPQGKLDPNDMQGERVEPDEFKIDQDRIPKKDVMIHSQLSFKERRDDISAIFTDMDGWNVLPGQDLLEALYEQFGEKAVNQYYHAFGSVFMAIRDILAVKGQKSTFEGLDKVGVGVSAGIEFLGLHTKVPGQMMFINPGASRRERDLRTYSSWANARDDLDAEDFEAIASSIMTTMVHECAHYAEWSHSLTFIAALQSGFSTMMTEGQVVDVHLNRLKETIYENWEIYRFIAGAIDSKSVEVVGASLEDVGTNEGRDARRPGVDVGERGQGRERTGAEGEDQRGVGAARGELNDEQIRAGYREDGTVDSGTVHPNAGEDSVFFQTVFHGSPFTFDEFKMEQIGTGEGAQAYGYGLYFAEERDVAKAYVPRDFDIEDTLMAEYKNAEQNDDVIRMEMLENAMLHWTPDEYLETYTEENGYDAETVAAAQEFAQELEDTLKAGAGALYEVEINDAAVAQMMDFDAKLKDQPENVKKAAKKLGFDEKNTPEATGMDILSVAHLRGGNPKAGAELLLSLGVPGIRFLDQRSRTTTTATGRGGFISGLTDALTEQQTRNMVLFSTDPIDQVIRNGDVVYQKQRQDYFTIEERQARIEEFMYGSHVVDENGDPLVVYHGSQYTEDRIEVLIPQRSFGGWNHMGTWFSSERVHAERMAEVDMDEDGPVIEAYVSIKRPFETTWENLHKEIQKAVKQENKKREENGQRELDTTGYGEERDTTSEVGLFLRKHFQDKGYDGVIIRDWEGDGPPAQDVFVAFESSQVKTTSAQVFDPTSANIYRQGEERGRIVFNENRKGFIELLASADFSTFIHETGHMYLEVLRWAAQQPDAPQQILDDWATIKKHTGAQDDVISREAHEKFANFFEIYTMEGKAPSIALQDAFQAFSRWLRRIYAKVVGLGGVHLNPEIRGVMDRLLASDEEIAVAEQSQGFVALFADAEMAGMSQEQFDFYSKQVVRTHEEGVEKESRRLFAEMHKAEQAWWRGERKKVRDEVEKQAHGMRVYKAIYALSRGQKPNGEPVAGEPYKIDKRSLMNLVPDQEMLNQLPRPFIYTLKGGVDVEVVAKNLGYRDGMEMITEIINAPKMQQYIEAETEVRMRQTYPDPMTDGTLPDAAVRRVHSESRLKILATELRQLRRLLREDTPAIRAAQKAEKRQDKQAREANKAMLPKRAELAMLKAGAREVVRRMKVRDLKPHIYLRAEQKAGREAFAALEKRDYQKAYEAKLRQIKNHEMYRAATAATEEAAKLRNFAARYEGPRKRRQLGLKGVLKQIDAVLEGVDLRKKSLAEVDRDNALKGLREMVAKGRMIVKPGTLEKIMDDRVNWQELTVEDLKGLKDVLKQIEHGALNEDKMMVNGELVDYQEVKEEVVESLAEGHGITPPRPGGVRTAKERGGRGVDQAIMTWLRPSSIARVLDKAGFGAITRRIIVPMRRAYAEKLIPMLHKAQSDITKIYNKHYTLKELGQMSKRQYEIKSLNATYSKSELLSMALNWGNQSNRDAVLGGTYEGEQVFSETAVREMLAHLTAKDWAFVQDIWDYNETYFPELSAAEERRRGIAPEKIEPMPFVIRTADGQTISVKGGYHPLLYDKAFDARSDRGRSPARAAEEITQSLQHLAAGSFVTANTRAGSTYNRVQNHGRVVRLGLNNIDTHLREVIRDIAIGDEVMHIKRLLEDGAVERAFRDSGNEAAYEALDLWLTDAAVGELPAENIWEFSAAWIRTGFTKAKLGWNFTVMFLQFTGLAQTIAVIGTVPFGKGLAKFMQNPAAATRTVMQVSSFLNTRYKVGAFDKDVQDTKALINSEFGSMPTRSKRAINIIGATLFAGIAKCQQYVDIVTWLGAYEKGLNGDVAGVNSEQDAIIYADTQVEAAQTSGFFSDRSGLERGTTGLRKNRQSQFIRIWTTLISYMLAKSNIAYEKHKDTNYKDPKQVMSLLFDLLMLYTVEGMFSAWLYNRLPEDDDEPEEWAKWAAVQSIESLSSGIPFAREIAAARFGGGNTPIGVFSNDAYRAIEQLSQGEVDWALIDSLSDVTGTALHLPTGQMSKTGRTLWEEGLDAEWYEYFTGPRE